MTVPLAARAPCFPATACALYRHAWGTREPLRIAIMTRIAQSYRPDDAGSALAL